MTPTFVEDAEALYRAIRAGNGEYIHADGKLRFTVLAFSDRNLKPSVDRSSMRADPQDVKKSATDGVTQVIAREVRQICSIPVDPAKKGSTSVYAVDAIHDPIAGSYLVQENLAHCVIQCSPDIKTNHFNKRVREALANIASQHGFVVDPT